MTRLELPCPDAGTTRLTYDDSGSAGRGGNGGLISRDTIRKADELRLAIYEAKKGMPE